MRILIQGGHIVNEGRVFSGSIVVEDGKIIEVRNQKPENRCNISAVDDRPSAFNEVIDASGCYVLPGIIDSHVHFREPGLTQKADMDTESRAAAAGGVTTFFDMPNTQPQTTTLEALQQKFDIAARKSHVNYSFFYGATNDNADSFAQLDNHRVPGIKLFMGSSTGNMLVDREEVLERIFRTCKLPLMAHCEDTAIINRNMEETQKAWGEDPPVSLHAMIRNEEACLTSTKKAIALAQQFGTRLHVAHVSTAEELELFPACQDLASTKITAEACIGYLFFSQLDHERLGTRIKVNPAIKTPVDQYLLRQALTDGRIATIATDHAPHLLEQKLGGCARAASGMPMVQFSLVTMLELVDAGVLTIQRLVELMCHNPASLFGVERRGFLREGFQADIVIVRPQSPWTVTPDSILSKCGWSPVEGHEYQWRIERTLCNGHTVYQQARGVDASYIGQPVTFNHS